MPERKFIKRTSRRSSIISVESTTSTLVNETPEPVSEDKKDTRKTRRASISESLFNNAIVLHRPKPLRPICRRLTSTVQTTVITPASKLSSQIVPPTKASAHKILTKVAKFSRKGVKFVRKFMHLRRFLLFKPELPQWDAQIEVQEI
ncbi:hypothetical protein BT96DRAFT_984832 [Gymnopus androsaceus JB14]|uniref:Uncharacterized protein n=1 Tax=Gymnopus androsaceus JB14 TaxID=1447944 RepID=A0A6A4IGH8_9AGAR|nr:hypothetical protein BT96DRAFT_984832 [Gymnopus androsaceus JB14]